MIAEPPVTGATHVTATEPLPRATPGFAGADGTVEADPGEIGDDGNEATLRPTMFAAFTLTV